MNYKLNIIIISIFTTFLLICSVFYMFNKTYMSHFIVLENLNARLDNARAIEALKSKIDYLHATAQDWSDWDDSYNFIATGDKSFIKRNLTSKDFHNISVDAMAFLKLNGEILHIQAYKKNGESDEKLIRQLYEHLSYHSCLLKTVKTGKAIRGLLTLPSYNLLVAARPIVNSLRDKPAMGAIIICKVVDRAFLNALSKNTKVSIEINNAKIPNLPLDFLEAKKALQSDQDIFIKVPSPNRIAVYSSLNTVCGDSNIIIRTSEPRSIYRQGLLGRKYLLGSLVGMAVVSCLLEIWLLCKFATPKND